jgi:acetyltransferase-like isoleucine patch superfamily enzyme
MPKSSFLTAREIELLGFKTVGLDAMISSKASFYGCGSISIGDHSRIDDYCVLSCSEGGSIDIGDYVHISTHCLVIAPREVRFGHFSGISSGCRIFGGSDDYGGEYLTNPCVPEKYRRSSAAPVVLGKHAVVGAGTTILYGVTLGECSAVGAMSLVLRDVPAGQIHAGIPARYIKDRSMKALELERMLREEEGRS